MATDTLASPATLGYNPTKVFKNFIDGEWVESSPARLLKTAIPPTRATWLASSRNRPRPMWMRRRCGQAGLCEVAAGACAAPRRDVFRAAEILIARKEEYAREMTREMGKVIKETRGDVQEAIDAATTTPAKGAGLFGPTVPSEMPNKFAMAVRQPMGVCAMITPWNFPMAISSWKLFPALVCGNTA